MCGPMVCRTILNGFFYGLVSDSCDCEHRSGVWASVVLDRRIRALGGKGGYYVGGRGDRDHAAL